MIEVQHLTREQAKRVANDLRKLSDDELKIALHRYRWLPTCYRLTKEEIERRKQDEANKGDNNP